MKGKHVTGGIFALCVLFSCNTRTDKAQTEQQAIKEPATAAVTETPTEGLPQVVLIEEDGRRFPATALPANTILIFFACDCDHCQREATDIEKNLAGFKDYSLCFVSMNPFAEMKKFASAYHLTDKQNVRFYGADGKSVFDSFGSIETPTICVYDREKKLKKRFDGETSVDKILAIL